ncbi:MAG: HhH-GPD family protein [Chthoniobacteraceae bacterium]|nr:HhH-GPD family protein [Chthoniobacteraceae bacterium]
MKIPASFRDQKAHAAELRFKLAQWFRLNGRDLPWRRSPDPYAVMVSEFMLQQTQVVTVIAYFERWLKRFPDFNTLAAASEEEVMHVWQGLGYYSRARNLHRAAKCVVDEHGGQLPDDPAAIARLPGVGRYTAGAIASFGFDQAAAAVDANIARVLARLGNLREPIDARAGSDALWAMASDLLPESGGREHTSALMELGALVCLPRKPHCALCPVRDYCAAPDPELLPVKKPRRASVRIDENCAWIVEAGALLLEQQSGTRWRGLWKLPALNGESLGEPLFKIEYPFTHHVVTLRVYGKSAEAELMPGQRWFAFKELAGAAFAAAHRRALVALLPLHGLPASLLDS